MTGYVAPCKPVVSHPVGVYRFVTASSRAIPFLPRSDFLNLTLVPSQFERRAYVSYT